MFDSTLKTFSHAFLLFALLLTIPIAGAKPTMTPPDLRGATVVTAEQAQTHMQDGVLLIDARVAHEFVEEHIKGAISIPYKEKSAKRVDYDPSLDHFDLTKLPKNKATPMIFYCNAGECWKSYKACKAALKAGYSKVYWLRGGIPEWKAKGLPVE